MIKACEAAKTKQRESLRAIARRSLNGRSKPGDADIIASPDAAGEYAAIVEALRKESELLARVAQQEQLRSDLTHATAAMNVYAEETIDIAAAREAAAVCMRNYIESLRCDLAIAEGATPELSLHRWLAADALGLPRPDLHSVTPTCRGRVVSISDPTACSVEVPADVFDAEDRFRSEVMWKARQLAARDHDLALAEWRNRTGWISFALRGRPPELTEPTWLQALAWHQAGRLEDDWRRSTAHGEAVGSGHGSAGT